MRVRIRTLLAATLPLVAVATPDPARAQTFNGGIPALWNCAGNCGTSAANGDIGLAPNAGTRYGWVSTANSTVTGIGLPGVGGEGAATNGSVLRSGVFTAGGGDVLSFWFNYATRDGAGYADYAWSRLLDGNGLQVALLFTARTTISGSVVPGRDMPAPQATLGTATVTMTNRAPVWAPLGASEGSGAQRNCWSRGCGFTGWVSSEFRIAASGSYMLEFGVVNWDIDASDDRSYQSGLAFDGLKINNQGIAVSGAGQAATPQTMAASAPNGAGATTQASPNVMVTPEPAPLLLVATGVAALALAKRRRSVA